MLVVSLGMDVMLAGGPLAVVDLSVDAIRTRALEVRRKGGRKGGHKGGRATVKEEARRAVKMGLCGPDTPGANLGGGEQYWDGWFDATATSGDRSKWVLEILAEAAKNRALGAEGLQDARPASIIARSLVAGSWAEESMYSRMRTLTGHPPMYAHGTPTNLCP